MLRSDLLPALTGRPSPSDLELALLALPARLGGLGIRIPSKAADGEFQSSLLVTSSLKVHILNQDREYGHETIAEQLQCKATVSRLNREKSAREANDLYGHLPVSLQRAVDLAKEKAPLPGSLFFPSLNVGSPCTSRHSMTPWPCAMVGPHLKSPSNAIVETE